LPSRAVWSTKENSYRICKQNDGEEVTDICDGTIVKLYNNTHSYFFFVVVFLKHHTPISKWRIRYKVGIQQPRWFYASTAVAFPSVATDLDIRFGSETIKACSIVFNFETCLK
jgi:hypothetical protein